jgi:hypothetical protein
MPRNLRVRLPVGMPADAPCNADRWTAITEFGDRYGSTSFGAGFEGRLDNNR